MDTFTFGGELTVPRLGLGTMRMTGPGIRGPPADHAAAVAVLRRAVDLGVRLIDTADAYGPHIGEELVAEALHPYPSDLVISTKGGLTRQGPDRWHAVGRPEYLRQCVEMSLRRLRLDCLDLYHLHRIDPLVPLEDQVGALAELRTEGKIRHIGLSEVDVEEIERARAVTDIAAVQNIFNLTRQRYRDTLDHCTEAGIGFIPFFPLGVGRLTRHDGPVATTAATHRTTPAQLALARLLHLSPAVVPIPGTTSIDHLTTNLASADLPLTDSEMSALGRAWTDTGA
ncbi:aldo/keto reductase [Kitasatospora griseola]|uniref:aldo/keto reductase n=1 Tax=Kitasatospora griseola TaxID=2064 RepID=UPI003659392E